MHLGWWLSLIWSHERNDTFNFTWSQNIYRAVLDFLFGCHLDCQAVCFYIDFRRRGYPHCGHARRRRFVWSPSDSPTGLSPDFGCLGFKMFGKIWRRILAHLNRSMSLILINDQYSKLKKKTRVRTRSSQDHDLALDDQLSVRCSWGCWGVLRWFSSWIFLVLSGSVLQLARTMDDLVKRWTVLTRFRQLIESWTRLWPDQEISDDYLAWWSKNMEEIGECCMFT